jgi:murein DD-endopeptidase MepM/ murein hydrolase activator NlpD
LKNSSLRKAQNSLFNVSSQSVDQEKTFQKVRNSVALFGLALSIGSAGILLNQQENQSVDASPIPKSDQFGQSNLALNISSISNKFTGYTTDFPAIAKKSVIFNLQDLSYKVDNRPAIQLDDTRGLESSNELSPATSTGASTGPSTGTSSLISEHQDQSSASKTVNRSLLDEIIGKLKSGQSIEAVAEQYRHLTKSVPDAIAVEGTSPKSSLASQFESVNEFESGKIVPISYRRYRQDRLARQIAKQPKLKAYRIVKGDTLELIAQRTGISQNKLAKLNRIKNPNLLIAGTAIKVPAPKASYKSDYAARSFVSRKPVKAPKEIASSINQKFENRGIKVVAARELLPVVSPVNLAQASERSLNGFDESRTYDRQSSGTSQDLIQVNSSSNSSKSSKSFNSLPNLTQPRLTEKNEDQKVQKIAKVIPNSLATPSLLVEQSQIPNSSDSVARLPAVAPTIAPAINDLAPENLPAIPSRNPNSSLFETQVTTNQDSIKSRIAVLPKPIDSQVLEQSQLDGKPMEFPAIPEAEATISATEMQAEFKQWESKNQDSIQTSAQTNVAAISPESAPSIQIERDNIREASQLEIKADLKAPTRSTPFKSRPAKVAVANVQSAPLLQIDRSNNLVRQTQVSPKLPALSASSYLPEMANPSGGKIADSGYIWPAAGVLSSGFGWRWGRVHQGIDISGPVGTPIVAAASGVVDFSGWNNGGYGNMVEIRHEDGTITRYAHNSALYVRAGQTVNQGQAIAAMGSTGFSTGPHLHFEIRPNGRRAVNPIAYLARR